MFVFIFFNFVIEIMLDQITINKFIAGDVKAFERLFRKYAAKYAACGIRTLSGYSCGRRCCSGKFCVFVEPSEGDEA